MAKMGLRAACATTIQQHFLDPLVVQVEGELRESDDPIVKDAGKETLEILARLTKVLQRVIEKDAANGDDGAEWGRAG